MSRGLYTILGLFLTLTCWLPRAAWAQGGFDWELDRFDVHLKIQPDGSFLVTETIVADFSRDPHHGIFREIPYAYRRSGTQYNVRLQVRNVTDEHGRRHPFEQSRGEGRLRLKIGSAATLVNRPTTYVITYAVQRALLSFNTHDELYWNVTGNEWPIPIESTMFRVEIPDGAAGQDIQLESFIGAYGSTAAGPEGRVMADGTIQFDYPQRIEPWQGFTAVIGFPKGLVHPPSRADRMAWFIQDNLILAVPVLVLMLLTALVRTYGTDLGVPGSIAVQYEPPDGLSPAEVGTLIDERVHHQDITATILDLAVRGYLRIEVRSTGSPNAHNTWLVRTGKPIDDLKVFEHRIMFGLFDTRGDEVQLASLETEFYATMAVVENQVYEFLSRHGYCEGHLRDRRGIWLALGIFLAIATLILGINLADMGIFAPASTVIATILTVPQFIIAALQMPRKTAKGRKTVERIKGLEEYLRRAEMEELDAAAQQGVFERLLPYAMALGLADRWASHFRHLYTEPPSWYAHHGYVGYDPYWLVRDLNRSTQVMTNSMTSVPRTESTNSAWVSHGAGGGFSGFGGGGFSGGGFGGGGGGGW